MRDRVEARVLGGLLAVVAAACGDASDGGAPATTVRDSAGIRIVEHAALDAPAWTVDEGTGFEVGPGPWDGRELFGVRTAFRLPRGRLVVADGGNHRLLFFAPSGAFRHAVGRQGEGPGEYQHLTVVAPWKADSLLVWDRINLRASVLDAEGTFVRSFGLTLPEGVPYASPLALYADGSFLANGFADTGPSGVTTGRHAYPSPLYHIGADGGFLAEAGRFVSGESYFDVDPGRGFRIYPALFPRHRHRRTSGNRLVIADNGVFELRFFRPDGTLEQIVRGPPPSEPVTDALVGRQVEHLLEQEEPDDPATFRRILEEMERPEYVPTFDDAFADGMGRIWVEGFHPGNPAAPERTWWIFAPDGALAGRVVLPADMEPTDAGADHLVGIRTDALGVERVVVAALGAASGG